MIIYTVNVYVDGDAAEAWLAWMRDTHIPDVLATDYFESAEIVRILESPDGGDRSGFAIAYRCRSRERLREYQRHAAPALQADHTTRFAGRFSATRTVAEVIEHASHAK